MSSGSALSVECLFEDIDFSYAIKREEFEQIAAGTLTKLERLLGRCTAELSAMAKGSLHSVERVGTVGRVPL